MTRGHVATFSLVLLGVACRPVTVESVPVPAPAMSPESVVSVVPVIAAPPAGCALVLPAAPAAAVAVGPVFVLVDGVGVLRIADGEARVVLAMADNVAAGTEMALGPQGELWLSDWAGVRVLAADGAVRRVRTVRDGPRYQHMVVRSASDVWAVTSDSEWELVHYDGKRWTTARRRAQFPGTYDDNKFAGLVVTGEGVWISSWNGLWRGVGADWRAVPLPAGLTGSVDVWTYRDQVIVGGLDGHYLREGAGWRALGWPQQTSVLRALADIGLVAAPNLDSPTLTLRSIEGDCTRTSAAIGGGGGIDEFVIDASGRSWVSSDHTLAVLGVQGELLAEWRAGSLPGLTGRVLAIAVVGAGPVKLPTAQKTRTWELVGRLAIYKNSKPLAGLEIELCSATGPDDTCLGAPYTPFVARTRTDANGGFRFVGVPEGQLQLLVRPPEDLEDCRTPFTLVGKYISPASDCAKANGAVCDLGEIPQCMPFEMPPPH